MKTQSSIALFSLYNDSEDAFFDRCFISIQHSLRSRAFSFYNEAFFLLSNKGFIGFDFDFLFLSFDVAFRVDLFSVGCWVLNFAVTIAIKFCHSVLQQSFFGLDF